ncbi:GLUG motif-containing protein [Halococcoides cellulosivorans]|uniref:GLUG motif-containing protein n=1 Tax=Halococcoides cellulosivorans TaxID=1679096 RepID=UPI00131F162E|nr:GLUG motif-containing protein [Halococcoides cellulosivorans]
MNTSYATGSVTGTSMVGGLLGSVYGGTQTRSYATGTVSGDSDVGGLIGYFDSGTTSNAYWDVNTTSQSSSAGGTGLTTAEMTGTGADANLAGFDFTTTWDTNAVDTANGYVLPYPTLTANTQDPAPSQTLYAGGAGTGSDPYDIANWTHLDNVRQNLDANYTVVADLDETTYGYDSVANGSANGGQGFAPIGNATTGFKGTFDGNGFTIENLTINRSSQSDVGLIGYADTGGTITNTSLVAVDVTGSGDVGSLVGHASSATVTASNATGAVTGTGSQYTGGLVGYAQYSTVNRSYTAVNVTGQNNVGGLVGTTADEYTVIEQSYATGTVSGDTWVGGLVGVNRGPTNESYAIGTVTGSSDVGGIAGLNYGTMNETYWDVRATGQTTSAGNATGLSSRAMTGPRASTTMAGLNFTATWQTAPDSATNGYVVSYPTLQTNTQSPAPSTTLYAAGDGTESDPYDIANWHHLNNTRENLAGNFTLVANLTETTDGYDSVANTSANGGAGFAPIGYYIDSVDNDPFAGSFEGTGYAISNLTIDRPTESQVGLFGATGTSATITNVTLDAVNVTGDQQVGGLLGDNDGTIDDSDVRGTVTGVFKVGVLAGENAGTVRDSYATGDVSSSNRIVGGLVGYNTGPVTTSYATANVTGTYADDAGGLVGQNDGPVNESYAVGNVSTGGSNVGGLVGSNYATVTDAYWDVNTTGQTTSAGGTGLTTRQLTANTSLAGFEFTNTWSVVNTSAQVSYPYLLNNTQSPAPGLQQAPLYAGGSGTAGDPYEIATWGHLNNTRENLDANYTVVADLNESTTGYDSVANGSANGGAGFAPIGDSSTPFTGTFDGDGYIIANLTIDRSSENFVGLFGNVSSRGAIENTTLDSVSITGGQETGGLAGRLYGTVNRSSVDGTVDGTDWVGVVVGTNYGTVTDTYTTGSATVSTQDVGGLVGWNDGTIEDSYANSTVTGPASYSDSGTGGLVGQNKGTVARSYATGGVSTGAGDVGGLVGVSSGTTTDSYWDVNTTGQDSSAGGTALTTADLTGYSAPHTTALDFATTWAVVTDGGTASYPYLQANSQAPRPGLRTLYAGGSGADATPYEITDWSELDAVRENPGANYTVLADLDETTAGYDSLANGSANGGQGFDPIGTDTDRFLGTFDGQGHTIANLTIDRSSEDYVGLFGAVGKSGEGTVVDLHLAAVNVTGDRYVGGLAGGHGRAVLTIETVSVSGTVDGTRWVGGLVGANHGLIDTATATATVDGTRYIGGLVGSNGGTVTASAANGSVEGSTEVGGLLGANGGTVNESHATGPVTATTSVGGLVGSNTGTVNTSYATGTVSTPSGSSNPIDIGGLVGTSPGGHVERSNASGLLEAPNATRVGGLVGSTVAEGGPKTVLLSNATGDVSGGDTVGGLIGTNEGDQVTESYATGAVTASNDTAGGLVGMNTDYDGASLYNATVSDTYATGAVSAGGTDVGGLVGNNTVTDGGESVIDDSYAVGAVSGSASVGGLVGTNDGTVANAYWDTQTTEQDSSAGGTGLSTADLKGSAASENTNLDFTTTWAVISGDQISYPYLSNNTQSPAPGLGAPPTEESDDTGSSRTGPIVIEDPGDQTDRGDRRVVRSRVERSAPDAASVTVPDGSAGATVSVDGSNETGEVEPLARAGNVSVDALELDVETDRDLWLNVTTYENDRRPIRANGSSPDSASAVSDAARAFESETGTVSAGYVEVAHNLNEGDVSEVRFSFTLSKSRLDALGVDRENVTLYRQGPDGWADLPTEFVETSGDEHRFAATTPGFSVFAIGTGASQFEVRDAALAESTIEAGETADVTATVENRGGFEASTTIRVTADGEEVTSESMTLDGGESTSVALSFDRPEGEYDVAVANQSLGTLVVEGVATADPDDDPTPGGEGQGGRPLLPIIALVVLVAVAVAVVYRQTDIGE